MPFVYPRQDKEEFSLKNFPEIDKLVRDALEEVEEYCSTYREGLKHFDERKLYYRRPGLNPIPCEAITWHKKVDA